MSKIGEKAINIPQGVQVELMDQKVTIKGAQNEMVFDLPLVLKVEKEQDTIMVKRLNDKKQTRSVHGLYRSLIANAIRGQETPWEVKLEIVGTGYSVKLDGENLVLKVGYSHPVTFKSVEGVKFIVEGNNKIRVVGPDRQLIGQVAHQIKIIKKPDVYKGKGIKYEGERLRIKPGKKAKAAGAAA